MLVVGVLFGLVTVGFVVPCLIDVAVTPAGELRSLTKPAWVLIIVLFSAIGAAAWIVAGRPDRYGRTMIPRYLTGATSFSQQEALRRHPAGRAMDPLIEAWADPAAVQAYEVPIGPDDDPEFLEELSRRIREAREADDS